MQPKPFALSTKVVIRNETGQCLLLKRSASSKGNPGKWEFPGGKAELGEKFDEALLREVGEETGLMISLTHVAGAAEYELPDRKVAYIIVEGRLISGELRLSNEHDDYAWVAPQDLLTKDMAIQFIEFARVYGKAQS